VPFNVLLERVKKLLGACNVTFDDDDLDITSIIFFFFLKLFIIILALLGLESQY
jgi:hypothetical protein